MKRFVIFLIFNSLLFGGILKEDGVPGIDIETAGANMRFITEPSGKSITPNIQTKRFNNSRAEVLWVDRAHQNAIATHVSIAGNGMWIQTGWYLNNERTSLYRTLGTSTPNWSYLMSNAAWYVPVDISFTGEDISVAGTGEPFYSFSSASPAPAWSYSLPGGFEVATSSHGPTVVVSDDGTIYGVLGRSGNQGRLFILNASGDTIRTITFDSNIGVYGLDCSNDCSVFCISTYDVIYVFDINGTRRDSIYHYGQTVARISGDGQYLVKGGFNSAVYFYRWNGSSYDQIWQHYTGHPWVTAVAISDDGSTIMAGTYQYSPSNTGKVLMYDSSSATPLWQYTQYGDYVAACKLSADGSKGVAGSWGQYNGTFGDVITVFNKISSAPIFQVLDDIDEPGSIFSVDISEDGSFIAAGGKAVHAREFGNGGEVYAIRMLDSLANDVGIEAINTPGSFLEVGQTLTPQAIVRNYGTLAASFNTVCTIFDTVSGFLYIDTAFVSNLSPGAAEIVDFSPNWTVPFYGTWHTTVFTALTGDEFPFNDTLTKTSICYHDGAVSQIHYPFAELTLNYTNSPRADITNRGSYAENIPVSCEIYDQMSTLVYTGSGQAYLNPLQTATVNLTPGWTPADTGLYTSYIFTQVSDDYIPSNDTMSTTTNVTTEILYDDGFLDIYGYVSTNFYDNKFAEKMIPCLTAPYYITQARFYVSNTDPIIISLNSDSAGLPGLGPTFYIAPAETIYSGGSGWTVKEFMPAIQMSNTNPFWMVIHWISTSPGSPYIGMDNTSPLDNFSYWYWTETSNPGWHLWSYDFMMRVYTTAEVGIQEKNNEATPILIMHTLSPNPFNKNTSIAFTISKKGQLKLKVYDISGRMVSTIAEEIKEPGEYQIIWNGTDNKGRKLSSGIYFLKADYEQKSITKKVIFID
jgi:hypothetical protein